MRHVIFSLLTRDLGLLKQYIRELPEKIIPGYLYERLKEIETIKELQDEDDVETARQVLKLVCLPNQEFGKFHKYAEDKLKNDGRRTQQGENHK